MEEPLKTKCRTGFTILELLIYLTLFALISTATIRFIVTLWQTCRDQEKKQASLIQLSAAHDLLMRDLQMAPAEKNKWKIRSGSALIWSQEATKDIGWLNQNDSLVRIEGVYNAKKGVWQKKIKSLVLPSATKIQFACHEDNQIICIDFVIADAHHTMENTCMPLKRSLECQKKADPPLS